MEQESITPNVTPAVTVDPATTPVVDPGVSSEELAAGGTPPEKAGGEESKTVKEIIRVRKRAQAAELELARLRGILEGKGITPTGQETPVASTPVPDSVADQEPARPNIDDFEKYEDFEKADREYLINAAVRRSRQEYQAEQRRESDQKAELTWRQKTEEAAAKNEDFWDVVNNPLFGQSDTVLFLIKRSNVGPEVAYYLGKNLSEANRINNLPPVLAAKEIGLIEARIVAATVPLSPEPKKVISQAPEPITPITPKGGTETDDQDLPMEDFVSRRNARDAARRRGQTL